MPNSKPNYFQRRTKPQGPRANERIRALDVQVIGSDGSNLGAIPLNKAIDLAKQEYLDLDLKIWDGKAKHWLTSPLYLISFSSSLI